MENNTTKVGFIGLGTMGLRMARRLVNAGLTVAGYDLDPKRSREMSIQAMSPEEAAQGAMYVVCMLPSPDAFREALLGANGVINSIQPGAIVIDMSTNGPEIDRYCESFCLAHGVDLIDAPVGKGQEAAEVGALTILAGGKADVVERATGLLQHLGNPVIHCGPLGSGQIIKLANNLLNCVTLAATLEAYQFVYKQGVKTDGLLDIMAGTAADNYHLHHTVPMALAQDFTPGFRLQLAYKDMKLASDSAKAAQLNMPTLAGAITWYQSAIDRGDGEAHFNVLFRPLLNG